MRVGIDSFLQWQFLRQTTRVMPLLSPGFSIRALLAYKTISSLVQSLPLLGAALLLAFRHRRAAMAATGALIVAAAVGLVDCAVILVLTHEFNKNIWSSRGPVPQRDTS